jgi:hypothetical protein
MRSHGKMPLQGGVQCRHACLVSRSDLSVASRSERETFFFLCYFFAFLFCIFFPPSLKKRRTQASTSRARRLYSSSLSLSKAYVHRYDIYSCVSLTPGSTSGKHYDVDKEAGDAWALAIKLFDAVDDNGDGELSWAELHEYLSGPQAGTMLIRKPHTRHAHSPLEPRARPVFPTFPSPPLPPQLVLVFPHVLFAFF